MVKPFSLSTKIITGFALPMLLMVLVSSAVYNSTNSLIGTAKWVHHTQEVISRARLLEKLIVDMETGERGFLITGKESFLEPFVESEKKWGIVLSTLKRLVDDNPQQVKMLNEIKNKNKQWMKLAGEPEIALRRKLNAAEVGVSMSDIATLIEKETGKNIIDSIRRDITDFIHVEEALITSRSLQSETAAATTIYQVIFGTLLSLTIAFIAAAYLLRTILNSIKKVSDATEQVALGDFSVMVSVDSEDQIGALARSFNTMTEQLASTRDKMQAYAQELERSSEYKSDFLATMSHEIRTPMNGVLGMLSLLMKTDLSEDQKKKASMAHSSAKSLLCIINDILDFSKIDAGKMELEILDFELRSMLGDFAETMAIKAQDKGLEVILNVIGIEQSMVKGDPSRIRQILTNLVGNAIKFTASGEIIINANLRAEGQGLVLCCSIQDTGIGIDVEKQAGLFEAFSQVDASTTRKYGGTGLGLTIVKKLCELMGGSIQVSSPAKGGSRFEFVINLEPSNLSRNVVPQVNIEALNLLVVDHIPANRSVLRQQLEHWGAKVQEAIDGSSALALLQGCENNGSPLFNIVFIDADLPGMNGAMLAKTIKSIPSINAIKIVMMTSMADSGDAQYFSEMGVDAYFPRPATTSDLFDALAVIVNDDDDDDDDDDGLHKGAVQAGESCWPDNTRLLLVEDNQINQLVAESILENIGLSADIVSDGEEALNMLNMSPAENPYTLILMDCQMPVMDGYEATRNIRLGKASERYKGIPVIALTANAMVGDKDKCLKAGMSDYLSKPIDPDELEAILKQWMCLDVAKLD